MDQREKDEQRERHERFLRKHFRTREEQKAIEAAARARRAMRRGKKPRRQKLGAGEDLLDAEGFEKIRQRPAARKGAGGRSGTVLPVLVPDEPEDGCATEATTVWLVVGVHKDRARVRRQDGIDEDVRPPAADGRGDAPSRPAVGDLVRLSGESEGTRRIAAIEPRRTVLSRPDPADARRERVLAANVDRALIVVAARRPAFRPGFVDRVLLALLRGKVAPVVCINKVDLVPSAEEREGLAAAARTWRELGHACLFVSAETGEGIAALAAKIRGGTAVLVGQSGVGKSSILNAIWPEGALRTGAVKRAGEGKGRHTTSASQLVEMEDGTRLIDTPGVRAFGLWDVRREDVDAAFPDVATLALRCRFTDCRHEREPGCAVRAAVAGEALGAARVDLYRRLHDEIAPRARRRRRSRDSRE